MQSCVQEESIILIVDDDDAWWNIWRGALAGQRYHIEFARSSADALDWLEKREFDLVIANLLLRDAFSDGWLEDCRLILGKIDARGETAVIITGAHEKDPMVFYELLELQRQYKKIENIIFKGRTPADELGEVIRQVLAHRKGKPPKVGIAALVPASSRAQPLTNGQRRRMYRIAISSVRGFVEANDIVLQLDSKLETITTEIKSWLEQQIDQSNDPAIQQIWNNFLTQPSANRDVMFERAMGFCSQQEGNLNDCTRRLREEIEQRKFEHFYDLLAGGRYTLDQVQDICMRIDTTRRGLTVNPTQQAMAMWLVELARTQEPIMCNLICNMLEINPFALLIP